MTDIVVLEPDADLLAELRAVLSRVGYRVLEASDPEQATRNLETSEARRLIARRATLALHADWVAQLGQERPEVQVVGHVDYAEALVGQDGHAERLANFARDALVLLGELAEQNGGKPEQTRTAARFAESTALKLELERPRVEACALAAGLVALGPVLVPFRLGAEAPPPDYAPDGLSPGLKAALTAAKLLAGPHDLEPILTAVEERLDGGGRPLGLSGDQIPIEARVVAIAARYARLLAEGIPQEDAAQAIEQGTGTEFDPRASEAFFQTLKNELYLLQLSGGGGGLRGRVLLADGDASARTLAEMRLGQAGFQVETYSDGAAAFEAITRSPPDVIVADAKLPKLDGFALLLRLRRHEVAKRVPVILVAAAAQGGLVDKALKLGAKDVLAKPINYELLLAKLRALTARKARTTVAMEGSLQQISVGDCFQTLHIARRTARAQIESREGRGEVYFQDGQPVAAITPDLSGDEAFYEICSWVEGTFRIVAGEVTAERNLHDGFYALLMRAAKQMDESRGFATQEPTAS